MKISSFPQYIVTAKKKWTATKYINKSSKWIETNFYARFDTLKDLKEFVKNYNEE